VETRTYPIPKKYEGVELAIVETPGKSAKFKSRIIGTITFSHSFKYPDKESWKGDYQRHRVEEDDRDYGWDENKSKYGWVVSDIKKFEEVIPPPTKKGIVFTKNCQVPFDK
jgi:hypothetical protein